MAVLQGCTVECVSGKGEAGRTAQAPRTGRRPAASWVTSPRDGDAATDPEASTRPGRLRCRTSSRRCAHVWRGVVSRETIRGPSRRCVDALHPCSLRGASRGKHATRSSGQAYRAARPRRHNGVRRARQDAAPVRAADARAAPALNTAGAGPEGPVPRPGPQTGEGAGRGAISAGVADQGHERSRSRRAMWASGRSDGRSRGT